ncbi:MAG: T9SS type A sorting domain-containing protein [Flavobacteriales bacterium]|nr:T9SS type A sorting domain-containing protein [Flavobacteriales bacterium]
MKRLFVILLLLASIISANAQNWASFPLDATSEWRVHRSYPINMDVTGWQCTVIEEYDFSLNDTILIDGVSYLEFSARGMRKVSGAYSCASPWQFVSFDSWSYLRTEDGIYYVKNGTNTEKVVADFNQVVGDTIPNSLSIIDSIDVVNINGRECRRQLFERETQCWFIEGVGSNKGTFLHDIFGGLQNLDMCYREFGVPAYVENVDMEICSITDVEYFGEKQSIAISPNPSSGIYRMETSQTSSYRVYDLFGRIITQGQLNGTLQLDLTSQPNGIYLISVENENGISTSKLVKQ